VLQDSICIGRFHAQRWLGLLVGWFMCHRVTPARGTVCAASGVIDSAVRLYGVVGVMPAPCWPVWLSVLYPVCVGLMSLLAPSCHQACGLCVGPVTCCMGCDLQADVQGLAPDQKYTPLCLPMPMLQSCVVMPSTF
jgi:hypothetical protein